jgi:nitrite reductase (NO-forming)
MRVPFPLVAALLLLVGCTAEEDRGGFGNPPPPPATPSPVPVETAPDQHIQVVNVSAPGGLRFEPEAIEIRAGELTAFRFSNADDQEHTFVVSELAMAVLAGPGQIVRSTVAIDPGNAGSFPFFCSVADHRIRGMQGTITVLSG